MKIYFLQGFLFITIIVLASSCVPYKKFVYLQESTDSIPYDSLIPSNIVPYLLVPGDIITVDVRSIEPSVTEIFKPQTFSLDFGKFDNAGNANLSTGYELDSAGNIELPLVGEVMVGGRTLDKARKIIEFEIGKYINSPFIQIKLGGTRYSALGEFNLPGRYLALQKYLTIFEAIAKAGDLTLLADRSRLLLIRQYVDGQKLHIVDLTNRDVLTSPFYYIQPGDQLFAEPLKARKYSTGIEIMPTIVFGSLTAILIVVLFAKF